MSAQRALPTDRAELLRRLSEPVHYDLAVVGGGATGLGVALDAAHRGLKVVLVEAYDFAKGTSSRATKLVHGGVRYLAQGNVGLVREALHERTRLLHNAPHIAQPLTFVMPSYQWWQTPFYGAGLKLYDALAGQAGLGPTRFLGREATLAALPNANAQHLQGGVQYWDGQFNDARLAITLAKTAALHGALLVNYCRALDLLFDAGRVSGLLCADSETGKAFTIQARCVVNAAGVWVDGLREKDSAANPHDGRSPFKPMVAPSQGVHIVVEREFLGGEQALMVPKTADGRVLFAVPWLGKVILGTTDTPRHDLALEPRPLKAELDFILGEAANYLRKPPKVADIKSLWVGLRPLVKPLGEDGESTKALSREHTVLFSRSGLVTVTGGKWTTYRAMAEDVLAQCVDRRQLPKTHGDSTAQLALLGAHGGQCASLALEPGGHSYGAEQPHLAEMPGQNQEAHPGLTEAMVRFAVRFEYARTVEDVLARRSRLLFLDARAALVAAPTVAAWVQSETGQDPQLPAFEALAQQYLQIPAEK